MKNKIFHKEKFISFLIINVLLYIIYYTIALKLKWEVEVKTISKHYSNITNLVLLSTVLYIFGNYNETWDYMMVFFTFISMFIYGYIGELSFMKNSISINDISRLNNNSKIVYISTLVLIIIVSLYHIKLGYDQSITKIYVPSFMIILIIYLLIPYYIYVNREKGSNITFHPHHWLVAWILALFTRFNTPFSKIFGAICIGVFIQGSSAYNNSGFFGSIFNN